MSSLAAAQSLPVLLHRHQKQQLQQLQQQRARPGLAPASAIGVERWPPLLLPRACAAAPRRGSSRRSSRASDPEGAGQGASVAAARWARGGGAGLTTANAPGPPPTPPSPCPTQTAATRAPRVSAPCLRCSRIRTGRHAGRRPPLARTTPSAPTRRSGGAAWVRPHPAPSRAARMRLPLA